MSGAGCFFVQCLVSLVSVGLCYTVLLKIKSVAPLAQSQINLFHSIRCLTRDPTEIPQSARPLCLGTMPLRFLTAILLQLCSKSLPNGFPLRRFLSPLSRPPSPMPTPCQPPLGSCGHGRSPRSFLALKVALVYQAAAQRCIPRAQFQLAR